MRAWGMVSVLRGNKGSPGERERSAQLQVFDARIIYSCGTHSDVGDSIFAE